MNPTAQLHPTSRAAATAALVLALVGLLPTVALGQAHGRVTLTIKDVEGNPLRDVEVKVTTPEITTFEEKGSTNKRGQVTIGFADATKVYIFHIAAPGYPPIEVPIKPQIRETIAREITLLKSGGASSEAGADEAGGGGGGRVRFTPTEQAYNTGVEAMRANDFATAESRLRAALELEPDYAPAVSALAGLLLHLERYDDALAEAQRYTTLAPEDPQGQRLLYEAHHGLGHQAEADAALAKLARLDTGGDTAAMFYNEAVAALKANNVSRAQQLLAKALEVKPDLVPALSALALSQILAKDYTAAAATSERLLELAPGDVKGLRMRWDAYKLAGDSERADAAFTALAAVDPASLAKSLYDEGVKHFEQGEMPQARELFERAVQVAPELPRPHYHLGMTYVNLQEPAKAKVELQRFVELAPDDPEAAVARDMLGYLK